MCQNVYRQSPDGDREMFFKYYVGCRILDKLHIFSNILGYVPVAFLLKCEHRSNL